MKEDRDDLISVLAKLEIPRITLSIGGPVNSGRDDHKFHEKDHGLTPSNYNKRNEEQ